MSKIPSLPIDIKYKADPSLYASAKCLHIKQVDNGENIYTIQVTDKTNKTWTIYRTKKGLQIGHSLLSLQYPNLPQLDIETKEKTTVFLNSIAQKYSRNESFALQGLFETGAFPPLQVDNMTLLHPPDKVKGKTALVTGANGFIASNLCLMLLRRGYNVIGTVRDPKNKQKYGFLENLHKLNNSKTIFQLKSPPSNIKMGTLTLAKADLLTWGIYDSIIPKVDFVFHTASPVGYGMKNPFVSQVTPAVIGTLNLLHSIAKYGENVKRVVVTSSLSAISALGSPLGTDPKLLSEQDWATDANENNLPYNYSKIQAESFAYTFYRNLIGSERFNSEYDPAEFKNMPVPDKRLTSYPDSNGDLVQLIVTNDSHKFRNWVLCTVLPSFSIGKVVHSGPTSPSLNNFCNIFDGSYPAAPQIGLSWVNVKDVVMAHIRTVEVDAARGRFLTACVSAYFEDICAVAKSQFHEYPIPSWKLPNFVMYLKGIFDPKFSFQEMWTIVGSSKFVKSDKTPRVLGIRYSSLAQSITDAIDALVFSNKLSQKGPFVYIPDLGNPLTTATTSNS